MSDPRDALARVEAMKAASAEEQKRRRQHAADMRDARADAILAQARASAAQTKAVLDKPKIFDPWQNLLEGLTKRAGVRRAFNRDGDLEYRVRSQYLLTSVICIANRFGRTVSRMIGFARSQAPPCPGAGFTISGTHTPPTCLPPVFTPRSPASD